MRFLEETARLYCDDAATTLELKTLRHQIVIADSAFNRRLMLARDAAADVGSDTAVSDELPQKSLAELVVANSRRVQEALRVLEELARLPLMQQHLQLAELRRARFRCYEIEQHLVLRLGHASRLQRLPELSLFIDDALLREDNPLPLTRTAAGAGVSSVHLGASRGPKRERLALAEALHTLCTGLNVLFIMGSDLDIALAVDADGLYLEEDDISVNAARELMPPDAVIGAAVDGAEAAVVAAEAGADYIIFEHRAGTLEALTQVRWDCGLPLLVRGEVTGKDLAPVLAAGADAIGLDHRISREADVSAAIRHLVTQLKPERE